MTALSRIAELCALAESRRLEFYASRPWCVESLSDIDFLTVGEREELHKLKLCLPTMAEEKALAHDRNTERMRQRRGAR